ncbi:GIY-YIG nuclease family protein [Mycolicibacillus parakoreensis]|uniref:GIY-YIG nuclease family protein n=1 Tax=Mycolicibacillus parakoreensis TaxID=1069221 RepID=A0ABY3U4I6_9MYCO|nr:GIY-YIG nuclease family protein [Mycolicibacillus parakoreensis]MCV7315328.1 GIY-YIG nuclease family protein [Mycolicibacillus parakoreensis]ULN52870.1 GIY-YIG nuclease family protein [Mycolicibacillus parakoreensis]
MHRLKAALGRIEFTVVGRRKQVYKITYPNGKIYVGMDLTGSVLYFGSPSAAEQIATDHGLNRDELTFTIRKEILWESLTATDAEVRAKERELIVATGANDPRID